MNTPKFSYSPALCDSLISSWYQARYPDPEAEKGPKVRESLAFQIAKRMSPRPQRAEQYVQRLVRDKELTIRNLAISLFAAAQ